MSERATQAAAVPAERAHAPSLLLQRCGCGGSAGLDGECAECRDKRLQPKRFAQAKLEIGPPDDAFEREADRVADTVASGGMADVHGRVASSPAQRQEEPPEEEEEELVSIDRGGSAGSGAALPAGTRSYMESRLGYDFGSVRVHSDQGAATAARSVRARAFTVGRDIVFGAGQYAPESNAGRRLIAHELTHVVQQGAARSLDGGGREELLETAGERVQRDLALEVPHPEAVAAPLTADEIRDAISYNEYRFKDPWSIRTIRDVLGLPPVPAIVDADLVQTIAQWQAEHGLDEDGKCGPDTTATIVAELRAEDQRRDALLLLLDNYVTATTTAGPTFGTCRRFNWVIDWSTSLRSGFIVQEIQNTNTINDCTGAAQAAPSTPLYWEAWPVDANGIVGDTGSDTWSRARRPGTTGTWGMRGRVYTVLRLDPAAGFVAGAVPDAGILRSTVVRPTNLGPEVLTRRAGGQWDCCTAPFFHRAR